MGEITTAGDIDGDGFLDLWAGARDGGRYGRAYLFLGPVTGVRSAASADLIVEGSTESTGFGYRISGGTDYDGDGIPSCWSAGTPSRAAHVLPGSR